MGGREPIRVATRCIGRDVDRAVAQLDRHLEFNLRELRFTERDHCDTQQALIVGAELGHRPRVRARSAIDDFRIARCQVLTCESREHQLPLEAEQVERAAALIRVHRAVRRPTLGRCDHIVFECGGLLRIGSARLDTVDNSVEPLLELGAAAFSAVDPQCLANARVGVLLEKVRFGHEVAIGIKADSVIRVAHLGAFVLSTLLSEVSTVFQL